MAIDRIDAHFDAMIDKMNVDVSDNKYWKRAGVHIGYYIEWAFYVGFANPEIHGSIEEIQDIFDSNYNGLQFLIEHCDGKFCDDDLNAEGKRFTSYVYDKYIENFEKIVGHKLYTKDYNEQDLQAVSEYLDKVYEKYLEYLQIEEMNNKRMKNEILERCSFVIKALTAVDVFAIIMFLISFGIEIAAIIVFGILVIAITLGIVLCKKILKDPLKYKKYFLSEKSVGEAVSKDNQFNHKIEEIKIIPKDYNKTNIDVKADETNTELDMEKVYNKLYDTNDFDEIQNE